MDGKAANPQTDSDPAGADGPSAQGAVQPPVMPRVPYVERDIIRKMIKFNFNCTKPKFVLIRFTVNAHDGILLTKV